MPDANAVWRTDAPESNHERCRRTRVGMGAWPERPAQRPLGRIAAVDYLVGLDECVVGQTGFRTPWAAPAARPGGAPELRERIVVEFAWRRVLAVAVCV